MDFLRWLYGETYTGLGWNAGGVYEKATGASHPNATGYSNHSAAVSMAICHGGS